MPSSSGLSYRPQLDGLRAFAVLAVVLQHALPFLGKAFPVSHAGVRLFFVLSGYLITTLLLGLRDRKDTRWEALGEFYLRRILRIWPLYFFVIALALALDIGPVREILPWLLTHTMNFCLVVKGEWVEAFFHFWTLAVEEQFYLLWPLIVLLAPRRWLVPTALALILVGPAYRALAVVKGWEVVAIYCPTPACLDTLGFGGLLAVLGNVRGREGRVDRGLRWLALPVGVIAIVGLRGLHMTGFRWPQEVFFDCALALVFGWLVRAAAVGFSGLGRWIFESRPVVYLGKISYGIYIYHVILPYLSLALIGWIAPDVPLMMSVPRWLAFVVLGIGVFVVPILSWHLMEKPINGLKDTIGRTPSPDGIGLWRSRRKRGFVALTAGLPQEKWTQS